MKGIYATLVKRELWEHRWLWLAPLIAAGLLICANVGAGVWLRQAGVSVPTPTTAELFSTSGRALSFSLQLFLVAGLVMVIYLLDCLYSERKDRSILFWKSLPVSDFQVVMAKFCVGLVLLPLGTFALATLLFPIIFLVGVMVLPGYSAAAAAWGVAGWLQAEMWLLGSVVVTILWYAPVAAWLMLTSVLSSRSPYFLTGLPLLALGVGETMLLRTRHVWEYARWRLLPIDDFTAGLQRPDMWIGLAVAAGMLYMVVRLRRYRDDT